MFKIDILDDHKFCCFSYFIHVDEVQVTHHAKGCWREAFDLVQLLLFKVTQWRESKVIKPENIYQKPAFPEVPATNKSS